MNNNFPILSDGSSFFMGSFPLPKDHWIYSPTGNPPMSWRVGTNSAKVRTRLEQNVRAAAKYAIKASTMSGKEMDFDPDAMIQNLIVGLLGYYTSDGLPTI